MKVIFVPDQVPAERQYALMLVAGGNEAFNHWNTFEEQVEDPKDPDQVWDALKQNFEQSTSYWYFRDVYLADFRKEVGESTADLDLCIREIVQGCKFKKEDEEQLINLYHATVYYEVHKYIQELEPKVLKYKLVLEKAVS